MFDSSIAGRGTTTEPPPSTFRNFQRRPPTQRPAICDEYGAVLPYDAFCFRHYLVDLDAQKPDLKYFSLLGLDGTKPGISPYDAKFHFAIEAFADGRSLPKVEIVQIKDPEVKILNRVQGLRDNVKEFALRYFGYNNTTDKPLSSWREMVRRRVAVKELVLHAGYVADCGDKGEAGWDELLSEPDLRVALVRGIVWKIVKEKVLDSLLFFRYGIANKSA